MRFSRIEVRDLLVAWIAIAVAFAILFTGVEGILSADFITSLGLAALTAGIGFLFHEVMHKYVAQQYGLWAEFRASYGMLGLALLFSLFGFILAAPGAVMISGKATRSQFGKIALAGPVTNIVLAVIFLIPILASDSLTTLRIISAYGFKINALLALFNMIPAMPFDGAKVYAWNKLVFFVTALIALVLLFASFTV